MGAVIVREEVCMGCGLCQIYCLTEHSKTKDIVKAYKRETPRPLPRVRLERWNGAWLSLQCRHCAEPRCVYACLTGAMSRNPESGVVTADADKCIGCGTCMLACPYGVLTRDTEHSIVVKCDLCPGKDTPICVANCPNEALFVMD
jgi:carbon-monoxide dehydrogenase iron sulfur subunit